MFETDLENENAVKEFLGHISTNKIDEDEDIDESIITLVDSINGDHYKLLYDGDEIPYEELNNIPGVDTLLHIGNILDSEVLFNL